MMRLPTIAQRVKDIIENERLDCFSFCAGYGMRAGSYVRFPTGTIERERRNEKGRCTHARYLYADGSKLVYTYSTARESFSLRVIGARP